MRFVIALMVLASCAHEISELGEFPCPENNECPGGRVCSKGMCVVPTLGSECHADFEDSCSVASAATSCFELDPVTNTGRCEQGCNNSNECTNLYCSSAGGICLDDCSTNELGCGLDRECVTVGLGYRKCVPLRAPALGDLCTTDAQCRVRDGSALCFKSTVISTQTEAPDGVCASATCAPDMTCTDAPRGPRRCAIDREQRLACLEACNTTCPTDFRCEERGPVPGGVCVVSRLREVGQHCSGPSSCVSNNCGMLEGQKRCTKACSTDAVCAPGFACFNEEGSFGACWPQSRTSAGCTTTPSGSLLAGLALLSLLRRRRRT